MPSTAKSQPQNQDALVDPRSSALPGRPIDLVHLAQQTLGDRALETELLTLFSRQADTIMARLMQPIGGSDSKWRQDLTHTLKGSARAVGAMRVASAAENLEYMLRTGSTQDAVDMQSRVLQEAVQEAQSVIRELVA